jgi:hypothetical protein
MGNNNKIAAFEIDLQDSVITVAYVEEVRHRDYELKYASAVSLIYVVATDAVIKLNIIK